MPGGSISHSLINQYFEQIGLLTVLFSNLYAFYFEFFLGHDEVLTNMDDPLRKQSFDTVQLIPENADLKSIGHFASLWNPLIPDEIYKSI
jgi:hypothetical protein